MNSLKTEKKNPINLKKKIDLSVFNNKTNKQTKIKGSKQLFN